MAPSGDALKAASRALQKALAGFAPSARRPRERARCRGPRAAVEARRAEAQTLVDARAMDTGVEAAAVPVVAVRVGRAPIARRAAVVIGRPGVAGALVEAVVEPVRVGVVPARCHLTALADVTEGRWTAVEGAPGLARAVVEAVVDAVVVRVLAAGAPATEVGLA